MRSVTNWGMLLPKVVLVRRHSNCVLKKVVHKLEEEEFEGFVCSQRNLGSP